jgi:DNA processing protein
MTGAAGESCVGAMAHGRDILENVQLAMLPGIGPRTLSLLLARFGHAGEVLRASSDALGEVPGVGKKLTHTIRTADHFVDPHQVMDWCQEHDASILLRSDPRYPALLQQIVDPPALLFVQGDLLPQDQLAVAIVGTRHGTVYGLKQAEHFAFMLARSGVTVVSGLARGIDAAAHQGALHGGGRTIAVLGGGLEQIYPSEHRALAERIAQQGAVISEYAPPSKPRGGMFPQRNRLISGLSLAVLVVEAPQRSGALITARLATEQNREVLAIPGPINSRTSRGCNLLIRDGAKLVQTIDDVLEEIGPLQQPIETADGHRVHSGAELTLNDVERSVLEATSSAAIPVDQVIRDTGLAASRVLSALTVLEVKKLVRRQGGRVRRTG